MGLKNVLSAAAFGSALVITLGSGETCNEAKASLERNNEAYQEAERAFATVYGQRCAADYYDDTKGLEDRVCSYSEPTIFKYAVMVNACLLSSSSLSTAASAETVSNFTATCQGAGAKFCTFTGSMTGIIISSITLGTEFELNYKCLPKCFPDVCSKEDLQDKIVEMQQEMLNPEEGTNFTNLVYSAELACDGDEVLGFSSTPSTENVASSAESPSSAAKQTLPTRLAAYVSVLAAGAALLVAPPSTMR